MSSAANRCVSRIDEVAGQGWRSRPTRNCGGALWNYYLSQLPDWSGMDAKFVSIVMPWRSRAGTQK